MDAPDAPTHTSPTPKRDPLESPLMSIALFGGVFLVGFLINAVRMVAGLRPAPELGTDPAAPLMIGGFFFFAVGSGVSVAFARRSIDAPHKNRVTGGIVGIWYVLACWLTFGQTMAAGWGLLALLLLVFFGVAWAVASGLKEAKL